MQNTGSNIVIYRTSPDTIDNVVRHSKYALKNEPRRLSPGDIILIAQKSDTITDGKPPIRYRMEYVRHYRDLSGESERIWGRPWRFIIEGHNCRPLKHPFDIREIQVSSKSYARGGTAVYIEPEDIHILEKGGYLDVLEEYYSIEDIRKETNAHDSEYNAKIKNELDRLLQKAKRSSLKLKEGRDRTTRKVKAPPRSEAFRIGVKKLYKAKCAICGIGLVSPDGKSAVHSAHIYPKELDGSDDLRNGLCLCYMHHWAFDSGWIALSNNLRVLVRDNLPLDDVYDFIREFAGKEIAKPLDTQCAPHPIFLRAHRKIHGFK